MHAKYGCKIPAFEPVPEFFEKCAERLAGLGGITLHSYGVSDKRKGAVMYVRGDSSGLYSESARTQYVNLMGIDEALELAGGRADVLKLNCEGEEFAIMEAILEKGLQRQFANIQVQNHTVVEHYENRWEAIREAFLSTHRITWEAPWVWTNFELK